MYVKVIIARYWVRDPRYVGHQPEPLEEQLQAVLDNFLREAGNIRIRHIKQSIARSNGTETALITIFYD